jgi:hypothetical protein
MLEWNIFSGFANTAKIGEAKKQLEQVNTRERELLDAVALQVRIAYFNTKQAIAQIEVARKARASAKENLRMLEEQYRENLASSTDVLDAEAQLARAESNFVGALYRSNVTVAELETAMGQKLEKLRSEESAVGREAGNLPAKRQSTQEEKKSETEKWQVCFPVSRSGDADLILRIFSRLCETRPVHRRAAGKDKGGSVGSCSFRNA